MEYTENENYEVNSKKQVTQRLIATVFDVYVSPKFHHCYFSSLVLLASFQSQDILF